MGQLVHQLPLQHLEQHGAWVVVQRCKRPQCVAHVLAVELGQTLHGLSSHGTQDLPALAASDAFTVAVTLDGFDNRCLARLMLPIALLHHTFVLQLHHCGSMWWCSFGSNWHKYTTCGFVSAQ